MRLIDADEVTSLMCGEVCGNLCGDYWGACQYKALRDAKTIDAPRWCGARIANTFWKMATAFAKT